MQTTFEKNNCSNDFLRLRLVSAVPRTVILEAFSLGSCFFQLKLQSLVWS